MYQKLIKSSSMEKALNYFILAVGIAGGVISVIFSI
jgi:hypothetical protein